MSDLFLAIDVGGTTTKAVLFDTDGSIAAKGERKNQLCTPRAGRVERNMEEVWTTVIGAISECMSRADSTKVAAVAVVGHSDGLYPIGEDGLPIHNSIQATDTRASGKARSYKENATGDRIAHISGTNPFAGSPASICKWLQDNNKSVLSEARWLLFAKDWVRYRLTGEIATDPTDASASFLDVLEGRYSDVVLELYGLGEIREKLPPIIPSDSVAGKLTVEAADLTGIPKGTAVVTGCHDVDAAAVGLGAGSPGQVSIVAGTFSINQIVVDDVIVDERWQVRAFLEPGRWLAMSTSPSSAANLSWFIQMVGLTGPDPYEELELEMEAVDAEPSEISFLPYVYGSNDVSARGSFLGIGHHHRRGHFTRAIYEGVVLNHRLHMEWLASTYPLPSEAYLTGGASRSDVWMQMFADGLDRTIHVGDSFDTARGAAALAAVAVGRFGTPAEAGEAIAQHTMTYEPESKGVTRFKRLYERFLIQRQMAEGLTSAEDAI